MKIDYKLYPKLSAQIINDKSSFRELVLFNEESNMAFSIEGIAAVLCRKFNGQSNFEDIFIELEDQESIVINNYQAEISELLDFLSENNLIAMSESPTSPS